MSRKIKTLDSLRDGSGSSSDEDKNHEQFFVGGGRDSGQNIVGPESRQNPPNPDEIMTSAESNGAEVVSGEPSHSRGTTFSPEGFRLGGHGVAATRVGTPNETPSRPVTVCLKLWKDGVSMNDGPLRRFEEPSSKAFIDALMDGRIPDEVRLEHGNNILVNMQRFETEFIAPKQKPFSGTGLALGRQGTGHTVPIEGSSTDSEAFLADHQKCINEALENIQLNEGEPMTQIQIRFPDNTRTTVRFNHNHLVAAVRSFIVTGFPHYAAFPFQLLAGYPLKAIADESATLKEAGLVNALVSVKFI